MVCFVMITIVTVRKFTEGGESLMSSRFSLTGALVLGLILVLVAGVASGQDRMGAWLDEIVVSEEPSHAAAITRLEVGEIDVFAFGISDPEIYQRILDTPGVEYVTSFGSYSELTFNPCGPIFDGTGKLNPFAVPRMREAMNWLIDRTYIAEEIHGGLAVEKFFPITSAFPDYARMIETVRRLEIEYAHNPGKAREIITEEMKKLGAELVDGKWYYDGEPVEIQILIRTEDERLEIGDYVGTLLENLGFDVIRDYRTAGEASPIWLSGDPNEGRFHIYTGGWITTVVARDQSTNPDYFYTTRGLPFPLWANYDPAPEFDEIAERLVLRDFEDMEQRREMFAEALELGLKDSVRVWLVDQIGAEPMRSGIEVAYDLGGGISGAFVWPHTLRFEDRVGGRLNLAMPSILTEPWNPIAGTNWIYDMMLIRGTTDLPTLYDPYTGLHWPQRLESAEVYIREGLPVGKTLDWLSLDFVETNEVPGDAFIEWNVPEQRWVTVDEKHPDGLTANRRVVMEYPDDLFEKTLWHDGSNMSLADMIMPMVLQFERAHEDSKIFDEVAVGPHATFVRNFRGFKVVSKDPVVLEFYSDTYYLDAELNVWFAASSLWPYYAQGPGAWHTLALCAFAEAAEEAGFSPGKADKVEGEWLNMLAGPSIEILARHLEKAAADNLMPFEAAFADFVEPGEVAQRWANLKEWYNDKGHFWVANGPYYMERAYPVEKTAHLKRFENYQDPADKWDRFAEPMLAEVDVTGPRGVRQGASAVFDIEITFEGAPYPLDEIAEVTFLLFDAAGDMVKSGDAKPVRDGLYRVALGPEDTSALKTGANRLEVAVVPLPVSIPGLASQIFVTSP